MLARRQQHGIWTREALSLLEFCFLFAAYASWQTHDMFRPDRTSFSSVFVLHWPGARGSSLQNDIEVRPWGAVEHGAPMGMGFYVSHLQ